MKHRRWWTIFVKATWWCAHGDGSRKKAKKVKSILIRKSLERSISAFLNIFLQRNRYNPPSVIFRGNLCLQPNKISFSLPSWRFSFSDRKFLKYWNQGRKRFNPKPFATECQERPENHSFERFMLIYWNVRLFNYRSDWQLKTNTTKFFDDRTFQLEGSVKWLTSFLCVNKGMESEKIRW